MSPKTMLPILLVACGNPDGGGHGGPPDAIPPYVLVHGAWMGAWVWDGVADRLSDAGAEVDVVELAAHGDDATPPDQATLASYVDRVVEAVDAAGEPVVLVGHSMGGFPISGAAEQRPDAISRLVYLAAYLPQDGDTVGGLAANDPDSLVGANLVFNDDGTAGIPADQLGPVFCADCSADALQQLTDHYRDEPGGPLGEPIALGDAFASVPRTYVYTTEDRAVTPDLQHAMVEASPVDRELEVDTSHTPQLADPDALAEALLDAR